jgi:hypothetical protein
MTTINEKENMNYRSRTYDMIKNLKSIDEMFDLMIADAFMRGQLGGNVPVDESREVFGVIKKRLTPTQSVSGEVEDIFVKIEMMVDRAYNLGYEDCELGKGTDMEEIKRIEDELKSFTQSRTNGKEGEE